PTLSITPVRINAPDRMNIAPTVSGALFEKTPYAAFSSSSPSASITPAPATATTDGGKRSHRKATKIPANTTRPSTARCSAIRAAMASMNGLTALGAVEQLMVREDERHHRLDHRRAANADARIVAALGDDVGRL